MPHQTTKPHWLKKNKRTTTGVPPISGTSTSTHSQPGSSSLFDALFDTPFDRPFDLVFFRSKSSRTWRFFETLPHGCTWMHTVVEPSSAKGKTVRCPKKKKDPSARVLESFILTFISSILARLSHRMDTLWHQACFWIRLCAAMLLK